MSTLAVDGGTPTITSALPPWPSFEATEADLVRDILLSGKVNYWTGDEGRHFEQEYAAYVGTTHAIAVANGTVSLELALRALGVGPGDEVITTPRTFIASASAAVAVGARPVFADVDPDSQNITAETIAPVVSPRTKAIIPVHLNGWPVDLDPIMDLAKAHGLAVIEDCAQAHGARYKGRAVGGIGTVGSFSFCQDKIISTAGEGGMVTVNDEALWRDMWAYKDHGKSYAAVFEREHPPGFRWLHESFGTNMRMTELQAAVGRVWLRRLDAMVEARRRNAQAFIDALRDHPALRIPTPPAGVEHAYYKLNVFLRPEVLRDGWDRGRVRDAISAEGVFCRDGSCSEIYLEKAFPEAWRPSPRLEVTRAIGDQSLLFLCHPTLSEADMRLQAEATRKVLDVAIR